MSLTPLRVTQNTVPLRAPEEGFAVRSAASHAMLRFWGRQSALSLLDQGMTSGAGFGVNLLLARWMPSEDYGAFALAFAGFLFISGFHNVLLLEPLSVLGPSRHAENLQTYFRSQLAVHAVLVGALSVAEIFAGLALRSFLPASPLGGAMLGGGLTLPFLLLLWLARRMCYVVHRPSIAVWGSAFYLVFVAAGLPALRYAGELNTVTAFALMACGSAVAAGMLIRSLGFLKRGSVPGAAIPWREALHENWNYGRWLTASTILWSIACQVQTFLAGGLLGLGAAGTLRAMQLPSLVMTQVNTSIYLLVLPTLSRDFGQGSFQSMRRRALLITTALGTSAGLFVLVLFLLRTSVEKFLFGGQYAQHSLLIPLFALAPAFAGLSIGFSATLRAARKPHIDLIANAVAAPVGVISSIALLHLWGLPGAAASMVASLAAYTFVYAVCYRKFIAVQSGTEARFGFCVGDGN